MNPRNLRFSIIACLLCLMSVLLIAPVSAAADVWDAASGIRIEMLGTQWALADGDTTTALDHLKNARTRFETDFRPQIETNLPDLAKELDGWFTSAADKVNSNDAVGLALTSNRLWTGLLQAGGSMTLIALQKGDGESANQWLRLRDPHPSASTNSFRADANSEIFALIDGKRKADDVYNIVRAELMDTYQGRLRDTLTLADDSLTPDAAVTLAEQTGLSVGYFAIVAPAYASERGEVALKDLQSNFDQLVSAVESGDTATYKTIRVKIDDALTGFNAAPLTDIELSRMAGQMMRYLTLVPLEYDKAVENGQIINNEQYEEAVSYLQVGRMAYKNLKPSIDSRLPLNGDDPIVPQLDHLSTLLIQFANPADVQKSIYAVLQSLGNRLPVTWRSLDSQSDIAAIQAVLLQVKGQVESGDYAAALQTCVAAYGVMQQTMGQKLLGFAPEVALKLDMLFWQGEPGQPGLAVLVAKGATVDEVKAALNRVSAALAEAESALTGKPAPGATITNTAIIVFREGLEAVLILVALLGSLKARGTQPMRRMMVLGALLACVAAAITGWLFSRVMTTVISQQNELVAWVSLLATGVMLLITNWFFHKVYWTDQLAALHNRKARILALGGMFGLFILGFTSVYREAFETALFLQPLMLTAGDGVVLQGLLIGLLGVLAVAVVVFLLHNRLPYKRLLTVTGVLITLVLVSLVGNTVYAVQVVGWMPISPVGTVFIPRWMEEWFGVYPTWQGIILQIGSVMLVVGSYFLAEYLSKRRREKMSLQAAEQAITSAS
jgi:high-affinity iron transporter